MAPGFIGDASKALFEVPAPILPYFARRIGALSYEADYRLLRDEYGIRRTNPNFWQHSDWFQNEFQRRSVGGTTIVDYGNMEDR